MAGNTAVCYIAKSPLLVKQRRRGVVMHVHYLSIRCAAFVSGRRQPPQLSRLRHRGGRHDQRSSQDFAHRRHMIDCLETSFSKYQNGFNAVQKSANFRIFSIYWIIQHLSQGRKLGQYVKTFERTPAPLFKKAYRVYSRKILFNTYSYIGKWL